MKFAKLSSAFAAFRNERGATMIEYALIAALIAVAAIGTMTLLGTGLSDIFTDITDELSAAAPA